MALEFWLTTWMPVPHSLKMTLHRSTYTRKDCSFYWKHTGWHEVKLAEDSFYLTYLFRCLLEVYQQFGACCPNSHNVFATVKYGGSCFLIQGESGNSWCELVSQDRGHFAFLFSLFWDYQLTIWPVTFNFKFLFSYFIIWLAGVWGFSGFFFRRISWYSSGSKQ